MHNISLQKAVQYLYGQGAIKKDKDIADKTGYNKATVSSYTSGRTKVSEDFAEAFERVFKIKLKDFEDGGMLAPIEIKNPSQLMLERVVQLTAISRVNQSLLVEILASQTGKTVMELQRAVSSAMDAELKSALAELKQDGVSFS